MCKIFFYTIEVFLLMMFKVFCFNLDTNFPIVYEDPYNYLNVPSNKSTYFGYSVILYPGDSNFDPWIQIGAPRGPQSRTNSLNTGAVFRCGIKQKCDFMKIDNEDETNGRIKYILKNAWIGGAMDINYDTGRVVVCAHKWTLSDANAVSDYRPLGSCYWNHVNETTIKRLIPLYSPVEYINVAQEDYFDGQAGTSAEFSKNGSLILGAPGICNWKGSTILLKFVKSHYHAEASKLIQRPKRQSDKFRPFVNVANVREDSYISEYDYTGYSVTSGYFYNNTDLIYVTSAPRSTTFIGSVLLFAFSQNNNERMQVKEVKQGTQLGEYFGASMTAGDINNDGLDDLIIGAPYYKNKFYNQGRIYVYLGSFKGSLEVPNKVAHIDGGSEKAQFGSNVKFIGDLNHDGFGDVAVAAPYELDGSGVVYIYRGTIFGLDSEPCQIIVGKNIVPSIRGFGIGISKLADIDSNGYKDIAIGAYLSGHTVLLRSNMIVTTYHELKAQAIRLSTKTKAFIVTECYKIKGQRQDFDEEIRIKRTISVDKAFGRGKIDNQDSSTKVIALERKLQCYNVTITMQENIDNIYQPLEVSLSHVLVTKAQRKEVTYVSDKIKGKELLCIRCPVHDVYGSSKLTVISMRFFLDCRDDNVCKSQLHLSSNFENLIDNTFVLGSRDDLTLVNKITNSGENAYMTGIIVTLPQDVNFRKIPPKCRQNLNSVSSIKCEVSNRLENTDMKLITLELDMKNINSGKYEDFLTFYVEVVTSSENESSDYKHNLTLKLIREADVTITQSSLQQNYVSRNLSYEKFIFNQLFQVNKIGPSYLDEVSVEIKIPHTLLTSLGNKQFLNVYPHEWNLGGQPVNCKSDFAYTLKKDESSDALMDNLINNDTNKVHERSTRQANYGSSDEENANFGFFLSKNDITSNNTFYINCSRSDVICSSIKCLTGPFTKRQNNAVFNLQMQFNVHPISDHFSKMDKILIVTEGVAVVTSPSNTIRTGNKPHHVLAPSLFIGVLDKEPVKLWVIILGIAIGVLVLLLLIMGLMKAGFFKRKHKEELNNLLQQEENCAEIQEIVEEIDEPELPEEEEKDERA